MKILSRSKTDCDQDENERNELLWFWRDQNDKYKYCSKYCMIVGKWLLACRGRNSDKVIRRGKRRENPKAEFLKKTFYGK